MLHPERAKQLVTNEEENAWKAWNKLSDEQRIETYWSCRTLHPSDRNDLHTTSPTLIALFGKRGHGKSAFLDTICHVVHGTRFKSFTRQAASSQSVTAALPGNYALAEAVTITDHIRMVDSEGLVAFNDYALKGVSGDVMEEYGFFDKVASWIRGGQPERYVDGAIIIWRGDMKLEEIPQMKMLVETLSECSGKKPTMVVTHRDKMDKARRKAVKAKIQEELQVLPIMIANYTRKSKAEDARTDSAALNALFLALEQADSARLNLARELAHDESRRRTRQLNYQKNNTNFALLPRLSEAAASELPAVLEGCDTVVKKAQHTLSHCGSAVRSGIISSAAGANLFSSFLSTAKDRCLWSCWGIVVGIVAICVLRILTFLFLF